MWALAAIIVMGLLPGTLLGETTVTTNGKTIHSSRGSIVVMEDTLVVDGEIQSGDVVKGSGKSATQERMVCDFTGLQLSISAGVTVTTGESRRCRITADDNLLALIQTQCSGDVLRIFSKKSFASTSRIRIALETPLMTSAENDGSGKIAITDVAHDQLTLVIRGSGDIIATGKVASMRADIYGSGHLDAAGLAAKTSVITVNGSGDATVQATDALTAEVRGSGDIKYSGSPSRVHESVSGSGKITGQ
jgi:hypothetical protein